MNIEEILSQYEPDPENILAILHQIQDQDTANHVSAEAMRSVSAYLKVPLSSVYGVLRYYSMYSTTPRGRHIIRVCNSVVCQMMGADVIRNLADKAADEISTDDQPIFTVESTECLGHCECAPAVMVDDEIVGPVTEEILQQIIENKKNSSQDGK